MTNFFKKPLPQVLVGESDSEKMIDVLTSTKLEIPEPLFWNQMLVRCNFSPWSDAMRFAERFGIFAHYISKDTNRPVRECGAAAFVLANDCDILNLVVCDTSGNKDDIPGSVFAFALSVLAKASPLGKELEAWSLQQFGSELKPILGEWKANAAYIQKVDRGEHYEVSWGAWASHVHFDSHLAGLAVADFDPFNPKDRRQNEDEDDLTGLLCVRNAVTAYLAEHDDETDGVSEAVKAENKRYLAQVPMDDDQDNLPTRDGRWSAEALYANYLMREFTRLSQEIQVVMEQRVQNGEDDCISAEFEMPLKDQIAKAFDTANVPLKLRNENRAYLIQEANENGSLPTLNGSWNSPSIFQDPSPPDDAWALGARDKILEKRGPGF